MEATISSDRDVGDRGKNRFREGLPALFARRVSLAFYGDLKLIILTGMRFQRFKVFLRAFYQQLLPLDTFGIAFPDLILQLKETFLVTPFEQPQTGNFRIYFHLAFDLGVRRRDRLDFSIGKCRLVDVRSLPNVQIAARDLRYKALLVFEDLIGIAVKRALRHIGEDLHVLILVALTDDAALPLFHVCGAVRGIQMVKRHELLLQVCSCAAFFRAADDDANRPLVQLVKEGLLFFFVLRVVDVSDLIFRDPALHEFVF